MHDAKVPKVLRQVTPGDAGAVAVQHSIDGMSLLWFQRNPLPTDWVAQREVVVAFDS